MIYLDNASTTAINVKVLDELNTMYQKFYGNPSSLHSFGHKCETILQRSRKIVAEFINVNKDEIYFTSGGTESNNLAIFGMAESFGKDTEIISTEIEHSSILEPLNILEKKGAKIIRISIDKNGSIDLEDLEEKINKKTSLCVFSHTNSEIGTIQDIKAICNLIKSKNSSTKIHFDCVQSFGKLDINLKTMKADTISFSSHKINGPKGVGGLFIRKGIKLKPLFYGGSQEKGIRPGTENLPSIAAFGKAVEIRNEIMHYEFDRIKNIKEKIINNLINNLKDIRINSSDNASPYILNLSIKDIKGEVLLHFLESDDIYISTGSACSSKAGHTSNVIKTLIKDDAYSQGTIRISFGIFNSESEIEEITDKIIGYSNEIRDIIRGNKNV